LQLYIQDPSTLSKFSDELHVARCLQKLLCSLTTVPVRDEAFLEAQIPLSLQVTSLGSEISLPSAILYIALHPLLTDSDLFAEQNFMNRPSSRLVHIITTSASVIIDHFTQLNEKNSIISIWVAAERILVAGAVWAAGLMHRKHLSGPGLQGVSNPGTGVTLDPIIKVSSLLASFAARWKAGSSYVTTWNAVVDSIWQTI